MSHVLWGFLCTLVHEYPEMTNYDEVPDLFGLLRLYRNRLLRLRRRQNPADHERQREYLQGWILK